MILAACAPSLEGQLWKAARSADTVPAYASFLERFPEGTRSGQARARLATLRSSLRDVTRVHLVLDVRYVSGRSELEIDGVAVPMAAPIGNLLASVPLRMTATGADPAGSGEMADGRAVGDGPRRPVEGRAGADTAPGATLVEAPGDGEDAALPDSTTAVLRLRLTGQALHQGYAPADERSPFARTVTRQYAGARMLGDVTLTTMAGTVYARDFEGQAEPPSRIGGDLYPSPRDAPFAAAFEQVVLPEVARMVADLHGPQSLLRALAHERFDVRAAAATALGARSDSIGVAPLLELLTGTANFRLRIVCARALGMIGDRRAAADLARALDRAFDVELRVAAAEALGRLGDPCAVEHLLLSLDDTPSVRAAARRSLRRLTGEFEHEAWVAWAEGQAARPCGAAD